LELYRIYTNSDATSWLDLCLYPPPTAAVAINYGQWAMGSDYCPNCPTGPFLDYSNLKYEKTLFDLPCRPAMYGNVTVVQTGMPKKNVFTQACYVSLGFVYDPKYNFDTQFPGFASVNPCQAPFNCPAAPSATGRHLLQSLTSKPGGKSGLGAK
jgi:hypothetical protein